MYQERLDAYVVFTNTMILCSASICISYGEEEHIHEIVPDQ